MHQMPITHTQKGLYFVVGEVFRDTLQGKLLNLNDAV